MHWFEPNLAPTDVKRQHYVPRAYLAQFVRPDGQLRVVDLTEGREYCTSILNTAVEHYFNDIEVDGQRLSTESWLGDLEGAAAPVLQKLASTPHAISWMNDEEETDLARFIVALQFRVPAFRRWTRDIRERLTGEMREFLEQWVRNTFGEDDASRILDFWGRQDDAFFWGDAAVTDDSLTAAHLLGEVQGFAQVLRAMDWRVGEVARPPLYTSDNPVGRLLSPVRVPNDFGVFTSFNYLVPISSEVLLKVQTASPAEPLGLKGARRHKAFSSWETSVAKSVQSAGATRFLYGDGTWIKPPLAKENLARLEQVAEDDAVKLGGFGEHRPPL